MLPQAAADLYRTQQRLTVATVAAVRAQWASVGNKTLEAAWREIGPRLLLLLTAAQLGAARNAAAYLPWVLAETGQPDDPVGEVNPRAFAGIASDGRPLESLLYGAVVAAGRAYTGGAPTREALAAGRAFLDMVVTTQVADTARAATSAGIAARPRLTGYVRMVNPSACSRCVVLAGKWFGWNKGFDRHPECLCLHIPAAEDRAGDFRTDPELYFDSLTPAEQDRTFTKAGAQAIRDGADIGQVVNARRGMATARLGAKDRLFTREGITRRGLFGSGQAARAARATKTNLGQRGYIKNYRQRTTTLVRLMPEQIYADAVDRADAIRLLRRFGYIF